MKIAVVGPSPVPFTIGGAENLMWGLCDAINQKTSHQAELIKLPSKEFDFWSLIENYYSFYNLDLKHFDLVISTKYPSWMVQHRNCICYMVHTLRGLYDTYHFMKLPEKVSRGNKKIDKIIDYMDSNPLPVSLNEFFSMIFELKNDCSDVPKEYFAFPAAFIRKIVRYMDHFALSQNGIKRIYAISETVKRRSDYFPKNAEVEVVYPPSTLTQCTSGEYQYLFMISRLDSPKRIDMLINAMKYVKSDIKLLIAGTGPQEAYLKKLAEGDNRISFLGFVNDNEVEDYYANALVIPYFPYDEDYGLITIEAMLHKKPVITTNDSGGPTEFVINNETGFITKHDPKAIAEKIEYFAENPHEARRMGVNGYQKVKDITWDSVVKGILKEDGIKDSNSIQKVLEKSKLKRKKITVTSTFPIYPPQGGGQARIYNLYKNLAKEYDVDIVSFTNTDQREFKGYIAPNLKELRIPKSQIHQNKEWEIESKVKIPITDIGMITLSGYSPKYGEELKKSIESSDIVIISHPYLYEEAKKYLKDKLFIYEAHNVESIMKRNMLPDSGYAKTLVQKVFDIEQECCEKSKFIMTCSYEDQVTLNQIYGVPMEKMVVIPNGVDCDITTFTPVDQRRENKKTLELENEKLALFMGSWHKPNLEACEEILKIALQCPEVKFLLMGSQCAYFENRKKMLPPNVGMLGLVSEEEKKRIFAVVDFALNPMLSGSGTNLKMFDYMSAGIPVITTEFGTRGIDNKDVFIISEIEDMPKVINEFDLKNNFEMIVNARNYVYENFNWNVIGEKLIKKIKEL